jgi:hypothetical protein
VPNTELLSIGPAQDNLEQGEQNVGRAGAVPGNVPAGRRASWCRRRRAQDVDGAQLGLLTKIRAQLNLKREPFVARYSSASTRGASPTGALPSEASPN